MSGSQVQAAPSPPRCSSRHRQDQSTSHRLNLINSASTSIRTSTTLDCQQTSPLSQPLIRYTIAVLVDWR